MANGDVIELPEVKVSPAQPDGGSGRQPGDGGTPVDSDPGPQPNPSTNANEPTPRAQITRFPYLTRAVVVVEGGEYFEWESVQVRLAKLETPPNTFRFTASEQEPLGNGWGALRLLPGDKCEIFLDGYLAITGEIVTRQVYYDGTSHQVELQGAGNTGRMNESAMVSKTGEWKNIGLDQLARIAASQFGLGVTGSAQSSIKFPRVTTQPGESAWDQLEKHARAANTVLGETSEGQLELGLNAGGGARVVERENILVGREKIHSLKAVGGGAPQVEGAGSDFKAVGQAPGNDDDWGAMPTHQRQAETGALTTTFNQGFNSKVALSEIPAWSTQMMKDRGMMERNVSDTLQIWVTVETLTWQRSCHVPAAGGLWRPGETVIVESPMLVMKNRPLTLKAVTFSQDGQRGTRSTLELVNRAAMGGKPELEK